jgi:hypothetical protein
MILKALTLENFKGIREPVRIEFAPLTLLFGPNNAGKSTIIQALMYAREVLERNNCDAQRSALGGDVIDLGGFRKLVHAQDTDRAIRMRFELDLNPNGLPSFMSAAEREDLERREFDRELQVRKGTLEDALGVDPLLFSWARGQLTDVWVEFEIGHRKSLSEQLRLNPVVRRYSVGTGSTLYATISLPEDSDRAALTYFNFGVPPFGWIYAKGDVSDIDWEFDRLARRWVQQEMDRRGSAVRGLKQGARVAFAGEPSGPEANRMSREAFDALVAEIVAGSGKWGDDAVDAATGERTWAYKTRQKLLALAGHAAQVRADEEQWQASYDTRSVESLSPEEFEEMISAPLAPPSEIMLMMSEMNLFSDECEVTATEEWDGWLLDWVRKLTKPFDVVMPMTSKWGPDDPVELTMRDTALPDWQQEIHPYSDIWLSENDKREKFLSDWLDLGQEYLLDFLSAIIVGPGKLLLGALQDSTYLGPFRKLPSRHYHPTDGPDQTSWANGLAAWNLLMTEAKQPLIDAVNDWLLPSGRFGTGYRIEIQRRKSLDLRSPLWDMLMTGDLADQRDAIRQELAGLPEETVKLEFVSDATGVALAPQDLGVGISQVLPVLVAALRCNKGVVAMEEPESNIHPAFQVVLADLFITQAKANPDALFLIETHSEYLMLRCLRRIRENDEGETEDGRPNVRPEDIAVHFVEPSEQGPVIHRIRIDEDGEFRDPWPRGFFPERMKEVYGDDL